MKKWARSIASIARTTRSIGVFDSGFGGLAILKSLVKEMPEYDYVYLGDTARAPYGSRKKEDIDKFTEEGIKALFKKGAELVIVACNSSSADALRKIQHDYVPRRFPDRKVLGVLVPASEEAAFKTRNKKVGVMATEATVDSGAFERELGKIDPEIEVFQRACPGLVPIVEAGEVKGEHLREVVKMYAQPLVEQQVDTIILGCTHYEFLAHIVNDIAPEISVITEGELVARKLKDYLGRHKEIVEKLTRGGRRNFYTTGAKDRFEKLGSQFFGGKIRAKELQIS